MKCAPHDGGVRNEEPDSHGWGSFFTHCVVRLTV